MNNALLLVSALLRSLSILAGGPEWGKGGENLASILGTIATLAERGDASMQALQTLKAEIDAMVEAGRNPSLDEWAGMEARARALHERIHGPSSG